MMTTPIDTRPAITDADRTRGSIKRYFVQSVSTKRIYEVNKVQYDIYSRNTYYVTSVIPWIIGGNLNTVTRNNHTQLGAIEKNSNIIEYYNRKMPGLSRKVWNLTEYFAGVNNDTTPFVQDIPVIATTTTTTTTTAVVPPVPPQPPIIITVYDTVASTFEPLSIYNASTGMDGIIENVEPMNIVVNQPFFYTPA